MNMSGERLTSSASDLVGFTTERGWKVVKKLKPTVLSTGGNFSTSYIVEKDGKEAFLKALDFAKIFNSNGGDLVGLIREMTGAYEFERDILIRCRDKKMSKVSLLLDAGNEKVPGHPIRDVPYLIFELADTDLRNRLENEITVYFKLKSLHNICTGLNQLHQAKIAHQDIKPSNVLIYNDGISKLGDLGRSICNDVEAPHNSLLFSGDWNYAPPEILYGYFHPEQKVRVYCTDMYLLGSLIVFYFTGYSMNAYINFHLDSRFHYNNWRGSYEDVIPYLRRAFMESIESIKKQILPTELQLALSGIILELCDPVILERGPKLGNHAYSVYKYINRLNILAKKAEYKLFKE